MTSEEVKEEKHDDDNDAQKKLWRKSKQVGAHCTSFAVNVAGSASEMREIEDVDDDDDNNNKNNNKIMAKNLRMQILERSDGVRVEERM